MKINKNFKLSKKELKDIENEKIKYDDINSLSIESLKIVQKYRGWISDDAILAISNFLKLEVCKLEEVATFYNNIFRKPIGKNIIKYCDGVVCYINNYKSIKFFLEKSLKIKSGQTTDDNRFTLLPNSCLGICDKSPVIMINQDTYTSITIEKIIPILEKYI